MARGQRSENPPPALAAGTRRARVRTRARWRKVLWAMTRGGTGATAAFRKALLDFGSETPDNAACARALSVGRRGGETTLLLRRKWPVVDVLNHAEGSPIPKGVAARFRGLTARDWAAVQRVATMVFLALGDDD